MIDVKRLLELESDRFHQTPGARERLSRRRDRKRRNQRVGAAAIAIVVMITFAVSFAASYVGARHKPLSGGGITPQNVGQLHLRWTADLEGSASQWDGEALPPTVSEGVLYQGSSAGILYAFSTSCGNDGSTCTPTWTANVRGGVIHSPTVADGKVFVATDAGKLYAFSTDCSDGCRPLWVADVGKQFNSSPVVAGGMVYGIDMWNGTLYAFDENCGGDATCSRSWSMPLGWRVTNIPDCAASCIIATPVIADDQVLVAGWNGPLRSFDATTGARLWHTSVAGGSSARFLSPVVDGDRVFVPLGNYDVTFTDGASAAIYAFPLRCGSVDVSCDPIWRSSARRATWFSQPAVADGMVYTATARGHEFSPGPMLAFPENCGSDGALCPPTWTTAPIPKAGDDRLVAGNGTVFTTSRDVGSSLLAFSSTCGTGGDTCKPVWRGPDFGSLLTPALSNGVLYMGTQDGSGLYAFAADCSTSSCQPAWAYEGDTYGSLSTPAVAGDGIYVADGGGALKAFALGTPIPANASKTGAAIFYSLLAVAAIGIGLMVVRRRRGVV